MNRYGPVPYVSAYHHLVPLPNETRVVLSHASSSGNEFVFSVGQSSWSKVIGLVPPVFRINIHR